MSDDLFLKIISREIPADIVFENDEVLAFRDVNPQAPLHVLIIPKIRIRTINDMRQEDAEVFGKLFLAAREIAAEHGVEPDNLPKILATKFNEAKDLYLSRATTDDDWGRIRAFPELNAAIESLAATGIPIDQTTLKPTRLTKNLKK